MTDLVWAIPATVIAALYYVLHEKAARTLHAYGSFGAEAGDGEQEVRRHVARRLLAEQTAAFWLTWVAVLAGVLVGVWLVVDAVREGVLRLRVGGGLISVAVDVGLGRRAWALYRDISERLERLLDR